MFLQQVIIKNWNYFLTAVRRLGPGLRNSELPGLLYGSKRMAILGNFGLVSTGVVSNGGKSSAGTGGGTKTSRDSAWGAILYAGTSEWGEAALGCGVPARKGVRAGVGMIEGGYGGPSGPAVLSTGSGLAGVSAGATMGVLGGTAEGWGAGADVGTAEGLSLPWKCESSAALGRKGTYFLRCCLFLIVTRPEPSTFTAY